MSYTDATKVSNFLGRALTSYETDELTSLIAAVSAWLDKTLGSTFDQVAETTRYYDGGVINLDIDPCTAITAVKSISDDNDTNSSYTYTEGTEYVAEPQNENVKRELRKRYSPFPRGVHRIAVTAKFSEYDAAVAADIVLAATRLSAGVIKAGTNISSGTVKKESLEGHSIEYAVGSATGGENLEGIANGDPTVAAILASRRELMIDTADSPRHRPDYDDPEDGGLMV